MPGQNWVVSADGGYLANPKLSKNIRHSSIARSVFRQYARPESGLGKNKGDTLDFNKISNIQDRGGTISELNRMPESKILIRRGQLILSEYGNSIPYTGKLEALGEAPVDNLVTKALMDDQMLTLDVAVAAAFKTADIIFIPDGASTGVWDVDGTPSTTATHNISMDHIKTIIDAMKSGAFGANSGNPIPTWNNSGNYICIGTTKFMRGIKNDPDFEEYAKYGDPQRLLNSEVGRIEQCRFVETNNFEALSNGVGTGSVLGEAVFFGDDPVIESVAIAPEIRAKIPDDYGRSKGVAWYAIMGFAKTFDFSGDGEEHIVRVTSA